MKFTVGETLHGFAVESAETLPEIDGSAYTLRHAESGARLLYLKNDDNNKAFSIAFKTPPGDSTGVFHILEHSVLCGSERFPVKEPFVSLIKSSMQTFLNALTFPDKTMYPVASTNEQDLMNLMDVYMDAVLNPAIYAKRAIFEQEGWHFEFDGDGGLKYNGVVYNEMKGALSDPDSVLYNALAQATFPDTAYAFESGGDPRVIPRLTYEDFLDAHRRHYRLDNSYLVLYGDMHIERALAFLDERYLSCTPVSANTPGPNPLKLQRPLVNLDVVTTMQTAPENACMGLSYVVGSFADHERVIATEILIDVLMGSNTAPLKRALLDARIADEAIGYLADSQLQPALILQLKGIRPEAKKRFRGLVEDTVEKLCRDGLDALRLEASLARAEFLLRERAVGMADGVYLAMAAMEGWLYDDGKATAYLHFEELFARLKEAVAEGYFEQLLRETVLESNHFAQAVVEPVEAVEDSERIRLADLSLTLTAEDRSRIHGTVSELRRLQEEPDSPEALATLPLLTLDDIAKARVDAPFSLIEKSPLPCLYHTVPTSGINYVSFYFTMDALTFEELPYAVLLAMLLGKLDTDGHRAADIDNVAKRYLGNLSFYIETCTDEEDPTSITPRFAVTASALSENLGHAVDLPRSIWEASHFSDREKLLDIFTQRRVMIEQDFATDGHSAAMGRCGSYVSRAMVVREALGGVDFYRFLKGLLADFDGRFDDTVARIQAVARKIFMREGTVTSFAGSAADAERFWELSGTLGLRHRDGPAQRLVIPEPTVKNEAFVVPADVAFAVKGYDAAREKVPYEGAWQVAANALSYDYLWNEVRVKGGAYGAGFRATRTGLMQFYSYRDPNLDATFERFGGAGEWLSAFDPSESQMRGYLISSVAGHDAPVKPRALVHRQNIDHFCNRPADYRARMRAQLLATTPEALRALGPRLAAVMEHDVRCAFGNRAIIEGSKLDFEVIDLLG